MGRENGEAAGGEGSQGERTEVPGDRGDADAGRAVGSSGTMAARVARQGGTAEWLTDSGAIAFGCDPAPATPRNSWRG